MLVTGIGQCCLDTLALLDAYPESNTKKEALHWEEQGGGPVATALVALSRLGVPCRFHGVVGDDPAGEKIRESLLSEGVDVSGLLRRENSLSQRAFIAVEKGTGRRTIFWKRSSGPPLIPEEWEPPFLEGSDLLLLDGLMAEASLFAAQRARQKGVPVMLDAGRLREGMMEIARHCDFVVASEDFIKDLGWESDPKSLQEKTRDLGSGTITITFGEKGSLTFAGGEIIGVPAFNVEVMDTTGAGDVFHAGYVYGILKKWDLGETIRFASAFAALKCAKIGGRAGIPRLEEVVKFLQKR